MKTDDLLTKLPCPLCIIEDRYSGAYSGSKYLAFNLSPYTVAKLPVSALDNECENFWNNKDEDFVAKDYVIGKGETPKEALLNLIALLNNDITV